VLAGTTLKLGWVSSGTVPFLLTLNILDKDDTVVSSVTPVYSGNGHYFAPLAIPTSYPWYVARSTAIIDSNTYVNRALVRTFKVEAG
jgi:hypothetical protein